MCFRFYCHRLTAGRSPGVGINYGIGLTVSADIKPQHLHYQSSLSSGDMLYLEVREKCILH
jgi:hypothetical protein